MENAYGIGITNRFALFLDEEGQEGSLDILKAGDQQKIKKVEVATKPAAKAPAKNNRNEADKENNQRNNRFDGKKVFDARKASDGPREERNNQRNRDGEVRRDGDDGERRAGRGRGGGRGGGPGRGRGGPGVQRGGKREFDRKSGDVRTGIKPEEKRGGSGKGNWGNFEDDVKADGDEPANTSVEEAPQDGEPKEDGAAEEKAPVPEEPKTFTLDEWKAQQAKKEAPKFNVRKAGEGQKDDPKWKKATAYKKENEDASEEEDDEEIVYNQRSNRQKKVNINFTFADESRGGGGGGRGGRGRGRGGRDRPDRGDRADRDERERGGRDGGAPRRGGPRGGGPRGGGGGGRGGKKEFVLQQDAFPTLG